MPPLKRLRIVVQRDPGVSLATLTYPPATFCHGYAVRIRLQLLNSALVFFDVTAGEFVQMRTFF